MNIAERQIKLKLLLILLVLVPVLILMSGCTSNQNVSGPDEIVLGYNADQSNSSVAGYGVSSREGFQLAVDEINANGGLLGKKIRTVILDDKADKNLSRQNMEQLIFQDNVTAVIGPANSANALYWLDLPQENEVTVIVPIATASEITTRYADRPRNYIFRISSLDKEQTRLLVAWALRKTNNGKIAIIHELTPYGTQGEKDVAEVLARWGKIPVLVKGFDKGASVENLTAIIESAKAAGANGICFYSYADSSANLLKALDKVKDYNPVVFGPAANAVELWNLSGPLASKLVFASGVLYSRDERTNELYQKIIDKYGSPPPIFASAANAYDAVYLLEAAIKKGGTLDRIAVRDALENVENVQGVIKFYDKPFSKENHEGLSAKDMSLNHWVDGKVVKIDEDVSNLDIR